MRVAIAKPTFLLLDFPREFLRSDQLSERGAIGKLGEFMRVMPRWSLAGVLFWWQILLWV